MEDVFEELKLDKNELMSGIQKFIWAIQEFKKNRRQQIKSCKQALQYLNKVVEELDGGPSTDRIHRAILETNTAKAEYELDLKDIGTSKAETLSTVYVWFELEENYNKQIEYNGARIMYALGYYPLPPDGTTRTSDTTGSVQKFATHASRAGKIYKRLRKDGLI